MSVSQCLKFKMKNINACMRTTNVILSLAILNLNYALVAIFTPSTSLISNFYSVVNLIFFLKYNLFEGYTENFYYV